MRIHKEGYLIILIAFIVLGILSPLAGSLNMPVWMHLTIWSALLLTFAWVVRFFRSPRRRVVPDDGLVLSPADGRIVVIEEVIETEYFGDRRIQVSVFMSPNNVHVNWSPVSGTVSYTKYHAGHYLVAARAPQNHTDQALRA
ncbi:hypothetical protein MASR1M74_14030 [Lentimicrobium sp.]